MSFSTSEDVEFSSDDTSDLGISFIFSPLFFFPYKLRYISSVCAFANFLFKFVCSEFLLICYCDVSTQKWLLKLSKKGYVLKYVMNNLLVKKTCLVGSFCNKELIYRH